MQGREGCNEWTSDVLADGQGWKMRTWWMEPRPIWRSGNERRMVRGDWKGGGAGAAPRAMNVGWWE